MVPKYATPNHKCSKIEEMDTGKFLHTNMETYLKRDPTELYIFDQKGMKKTEKMLQYKYNNIRSAYTANFQKAKGVSRQKIFNLDQERRGIKVDYNPPKNFATSYSDQFAKGGDGNAIKTVGNNY